eukprot:5793098-Prymnesium_polylepis.4
MEYRQWPCVRLSVAVVAFEPHCTPSRASHVRRADGTNRRSAPRVPPGFAPLAVGGTLLGLVFADLAGETA